MHADLPLSAGVVPRDLGPKPFVLGGVALGNCSLISVGMLLRLPQRPDQEGMKVSRGCRQMVY